ncbi:MAG: hypothetical protein JXM70_17620 [Pirellulales bacterium]|nr:hypothetical protein [Pirellulales bacterium]
MDKQLPQFIVDANQQKTAVIVPVDQWEHILAELEELDDIRTYDAAKASVDESIPFEQAVNEIKSGDS